jgi:hypothetical protein
VSTERQPGAAGASNGDAGAWFSCVGQPPAASDQRIALALLRADPVLAGAELRFVAHWHDARDFVLAAEADSGWWNHEEEERERLWERAAERRLEDELLERLATAADEVAAVARAAAAAAADRHGVADPMLVRCATDAASMAAHQHALAVLAGAGDTHLFVAKRALFAAGRWPLGLLRGTYAVF